MTLDAKLFYFLNNLAGKSRVFDDFVIFLAAYLQYFLIAIFILLLFFSAYSRREKIRIFLTTIISMVIARLGIVEIIRFLYHRPRPFVDLTANKLLSSDWLYSDKEWSFPSGHSALFFAMAAAVYFYNKKWGVGFFIFAILMNASRVVAGVHYPLDILGGAAIGILTARLAIYFAERKK